MPFVGEIRIIAGNRVPIDWAPCLGQIMSISENEPLFQLIGTTYGGDGLETFALPNLQGRVPLHWGNGHTYGTAEGVEQVTITANQLPPHVHKLDGMVYIPAMGANPGNLVTASNNYPSITNGSRMYSTVKDANNKQLGPVFVSPYNSSTNTMMNVLPTGRSMPKANMQPYLAVTFIISLYGIFPNP